MKELSGTNNKEQHERPHTWNWKATVKKSSFNSCIFFPGMLKSTTNPVLHTVLWGCYRNGMKEYHSCGFSQQLWKHSRLNIMVVSLLLTCLSSPSTSEVLLATLVSHVCFGIHCCFSNIFLKVRLRKIKGNPGQFALNSSRCYSFLKKEQVGRLGWLTQHKDQMQVRRAQKKSRMKATLPGSKTSFN